MTERTSFKDLMMGYSKQGLQKELTKLQKTYQYHSGYASQAEEILSGNSHWTTSQPELQLKKHTKGMLEAERKIKIIQEVACKKFDLCP